jgi:hypothetical protein
MIFSQSLYCSDPRDKLYGIRSILLPEYAQLITLDYSQSLEEVLTNFAKECLGFVLCLVAEFVYIFWGLLCYGVAVKSLVWVVA